MLHFQEGLIIFVLNAPLFKIVLPLGGGMCGHIPHDVIGRGARPDVSPEPDYAPPWETIVHPTPYLNQSDLMRRDTTIPKPSQQFTISHFL